MTGADSAAETARALLDESSFMTLATADAAGVPWACPVWFATADHRTLYWVSAPSSRHSRNLAVRPELSIVVFDSTVRPYHVQAVYMVGTGEEVSATAEGLAVYSARSVARGLPPWDASRVTGDARLRLYRATVTEHYILDPDASVDTRIPVTL